MYISINYITCGGDFHFFALYILSLFQSVFGSVVFVPEDAFVVFFAYVVSAASLLRDFTVTQQCQPARDT